MKIAIDQIIEVNNGGFNTIYHQSYHITYTVLITDVREIDGTQHIKYDYATIIAYISLPTHTKLHEYQGLEDRLIDIAADELQRRKDYKLMLEHLNTHLSKNSKIVNLK